jgi:hypothetical protein
MDKKGIFVSIITAGVFGVIMINQTQYTIFNIPLFVYQSFIFVLIMYAIYLIPNMHRRFISILKTPNLNNLTLEKGEIRDKIYFLKLKNRETRKKQIVVGKIEIGNRDKWFNSIKYENCAIENGKFLEIPFLRWSKTYNFFSFITPDKPDPEAEIFKFGDYEFEVAITYGFSFIGEGRIKRFIVAISFGELNGVSIKEIRHND